jgi:asparagine synthase (glutamine-hydrolysing)
MCGICGVMEMDGRPVLKTDVAAMMSTLAHRGPDGAGSYVQGEIGLGHRRLSIIDLSGGAQPIPNEDGSLHIVFNGEIYNYIELRGELLKHGHIFVTNSDTEVIIHAYEQWGADCVLRFNGIFAFALWDHNKRELFLARDHLGVKPLYFTQRGNRFSFASEVKALLSDPECERDVDLTALAQLFTLRYVPSPRTLFQDISKLPPAHWMRVSHSGVEVKHYWTRVPEINTQTSAGILVEQYQSLVEDAVRLQMRSDVPVGLFLSSGVDSGALLALMSKLTNHPVKTFTIGFDGGERTNETHEARSMARMFGSEHSEMIVSARDYENYYERYLWDIEEPVGNETAAAFYFVSLIAGRSVKVALTGQGADEPWGGYHRYIGVQLSKTYSRLPRRLTDGIVRPLVCSFIKQEKLRRGVISLTEPDVLKRFINIYSFYDSRMKHDLFQTWLREAIGTEGSQACGPLASLQAPVSHLDPVSQMMYIDTRANLPDDLLMVGDKTSMANSLEARVPFLDPRVVEFVESLPPNLKLHRFERKYLHKKALEKYLPREIVYRKKKGFANPVDKWLRSSMKKYIGDCLLSGSSAVNHYFNRAYVQQLLANHESGRQEHLRHIYLLISFELWHRAFMRSGPPARCEVAS